MDDYKPNSHRFKEMQKASTATEERQKLEPVVNAPVKVKKKNEVSKLKDIFISEDASNLKSYILMDVLVPAVKKAVSDIFTNGIDMILYGNSGGSKKRSTADRVSFRDYSSMSSNRQHSAPRTSVSVSVDEVIFSTRGEAEEVLCRMEEIIETFGVVRVADFYDLADITGSYTDNRYGWMSLRTVDVVRVRDGYKLTLPKAMPVS